MNRHGLSLAGAVAEKTGRGKACLPEEMIMKELQICKDDDAGGDLVDDSVLETASSRRYYCVTVTQVARCVTMTQVARC